MEVCRDCAISVTTGWAFSWTSLLIPRPCWLHRLPVTLHKVNHKLGNCKNFVGKKGSLYFMRLFSLSKWRERRMGVIWQELGTLTTVRAREWLQ